MDVSKFSSLNKEQQEYVLKILQDIKETGKSDLLGQVQNATHERQPVDIITFIEDDYYLGKVTNNGKLIRPRWLEIIKQIYNPNNYYTEIVFGGPIGIGKTTIAAICLVYELYLNTCLVNPHNYYSLMKSKLGFGFFSITKEQAKNTGEEKIIGFIEDSPYFQEISHMHKVNDRTKIKFSKNISIIYGSQPTHMIGYDVICGILDELNFRHGSSKAINKEDLATNQHSAFSLYRTVVTRLSSRFTVNGKIRGKVFLLSSANNDYDFINTYIETVRHRRDVLVINEPAYKFIKPIHKKTFRVAVGNVMLPSFIVQEKGVKTVTLEKKGYKVFYVPMDYYDAFVQDIDIKIRDVLGQSLTVNRLYIKHTDRILKFIRKNKRKHPFTQETIQIGLINDVDVEIQDYLLLDELGIKLDDNENLLKDDRLRPHYIHCDVSKNGDKFGMVMGRGNGKRIKKMKGPNGKERHSSEDLIYITFAVRFSCLDGDEIDYGKIRNFIYYLKNILNYNIVKVTFDSYQSVDFIQHLVKNRVNAELLSVDRTYLPYNSLRNALLTDSIDIYDSTILFGDKRIDRKDSELFYLVDTAKKVDHDHVHCFAANTVIELYNSDNRTIEDLCANGFENEKVYSVDLEGNVVINGIYNCFISGYATALVKVTLDDNRTITCTDNHRFMLRDGKYIMAKNISKDTKLMSLYSKHDDTTINILNKNINNINNSLYVQHIVKNVEYIDLPSPVPVYDLTIRNNPNFALAAGVFVHNSKDVSDALAGVCYSIATDVESSRAEVTKEDMSDFSRFLKALAGTNTIPKKKTLFDKMWGRQKR